MDSISFAIKSNGTKIVRLSSLRRKHHSKISFLEFECQDADCNRCYGWGDPHMVTYDNAKTDAYGIAQFIMSKSDGAGSIPPFALKV